MRQRTPFKNLPKIQAKRFKKLRLEKERLQATHRMVRQAGRRSRRGKG
jgi:hypothetical protein